jgi:hypothetical protein
VVSDRGREFIHAYAAQQTNRERGELRPGLKKRLEIEKRERERESEEEGVEAESKVKLVVCEPNREREEIVA